jgi:CDGSH-type Zn-finger protein
MGGSFQGWPNGFCGAGRIGSIIILVITGATCDPPPSLTSRKKRGLMPANDQHSKRITVEFDGSYKVEGDIPLVRKVQVVSEYGEPLTWKKEETIPAEPPYFLCRCGHSHIPPFCDSTHCEIGFDGAETADLTPTAERQQIYPDSTGIVIKRDKSLCMDSGFCGNRLANIRKLAAQTADPQVRAQVMAMIERCPSGSYMYSLDADGADVEPDLPAQIADTVEITDEGPIRGPLWVTGSIPIIQSDGNLLEQRNRVTLCNCGESKNKPLCDGAHRGLPERRIPKP